GPVPGGRRPGRAERDVPLALPRRGPDPRRDRGRIARQTRGQLVQARLVGRGTTHTSRRGSAFPGTARLLAVGFRPPHTERWTGSACACGPGSRQFDATGGCDDTRRRETRLVR